MERRGFGRASENRRGQGEGGGAAKGRECDDDGLDCATVADGMPAYGGKLFEEVTGYSPIAGTDPELVLSDVEAGSNAASRLNGAYFEQQLNGWRL